MNHAVSGQNINPVEVNSIVELQSYLDDDNVNVIVAPGIYKIGPEYVKLEIINSPEFFKFTGKRSTYDFTGVTFEFDTQIFQSFGRKNIVEIAVSGEDLILKNLTIIDKGNHHPHYKAQTVVLDGYRNTIDGFNINLRGSNPYGYGDIFGKGAKSVIRHNKHSAIKVRGDNSHLRNTKIFHRSYGHAIFCQGSVDAIIEGCYIEGEMRTSDDVLAEKGSGSAADKVNFKTVWDYPLQPGWMFSLQEDGIRAYTDGVDPEGKPRATKNLTVIDCTIKNMRTGVTIGFARGDKYVKGCVAIGTEHAYWVGHSGEVVESSGNASYGPLLTNNYQHDKNSTIELTVLDHEEVHHNAILAYIGGANHNITLKSRNSILKSDMNVMISGIRKGLRFHKINPKYNDFKSSNIYLKNHTPYPILLGEKSTGIAGISAGTVTNMASANHSIETTESDRRGGFGVLQSIKAEEYSAQNGVSIKNTTTGNRYIGDIESGDWLAFTEVFLGSGPNRFKAKLQNLNRAPSNIEIRLGSITGEVIGNCPIPVNLTAINTSKQGVKEKQASDEWTTVTIELDEPRGKQDIYLVFTGESGQLLNLDAIKFDVELDFVSDEHREKLY